MCYRDECDHWAGYDQKNMHGIIQRQSKNLGILKVTVPPNDFGSILHSVAPLTFSPNPCAVHYIPNSSTVKYGSDSS